MLTHSTKQKGLVSTTMLTLSTKQKGQYHNADTFYSAGMLLASASVLTRSTKQALGQCTNAGTFD